MKRSGLLVVLAALALVAALPACALAIHVYKGPTEISGTVVQVYSGISFAVFDGERTSVVALEGVETPEPGEIGFVNSSKFLHEQIYKQKVRVEITRIGESLTYGRVFNEAGENINQMVLSQPYAKAIEVPELLGGLASLSLKGDQFISSAAGISITKPDRWEFLSIDDISSEEEGSVGQLDDRELERVARNRKGRPLVVISRFEEPYAGYNPKLTIVTESIGGQLGKDPTDLMVDYVSDLQKKFYDYTLMENITPIKIGGLNGAYIRLAFTREIKGGESYQTVNKIYLVPRGTVMFIITGITQVGEFRDYEGSFNEMIKSVDIER